MKAPKIRRSTSWQAEAQRYHESVGEKGHYFHQKVVIPGVLRLLNLTAQSSVLDLGCGQGVLARQLPQHVPYVGVDSAASLIELAQKYDKNRLHTYVLGDATRAIAVPKTDFTHATCILALQNMEKQDQAILTAHKHLADNGVFVFVLNHPAFRIPRQSSWGVDEQNKLQYRRVNRYLSPLSIPITMHPGEKDSSLTWSFHQPISYYAKALNQFGFVIEKLEEWTSDKVSVGSAARSENRGRSEFPLFLAIKARTSKK